MSEDPEEALFALAQDLVQEIAAGQALELMGGPITPRAVVTSTDKRAGAWAVHPMLGHHLLTRFAGDTISGTAHQHVPRPLGLEEAVPQGVLTVKQLEASHQSVTSMVQAAERAAEQAAKARTKKPGSVSHKKKTPGH